MDDTMVSAATFRLLLNGVELSPELTAAVEGVTVEDEVNVPAMFTIKFNIVDFEKGMWRGTDLNTFKPGDGVKVLMGLDSAAAMITGEISSLDLTFGEASCMEIRGYDRLYRFRIGTKRRSFKDMKDSDVASSVASEIGLTPEVTDTGTVHPYLFQNNQTNYEFLLERAERIGYEMLVDDKTFKFRPSQEDKAARATLQYGVELESLAIRMKTLTRGSEVEIRGWDMKGKKEVTSTASLGSETTTMDGKESGYKLTESAFGPSAVAVLDDGVIDAAEAEKVAKARHNVMLRDFITGEGTCWGNPALRAGTTVGIKGIGDRFSGVYYVVSSVHSIDDGGYTTRFRVWRTGV